MVIGGVVGAVAGGTVGAIATPQSNDWLHGLTVMGNAFLGALIGGLTGVLTGYLIGKLKQTKFIINGNKNKFIGLHDELVKKAYNPG
jgi:ABC-type xylose transport system permease subunit